MRFLRSQDDSWRRNAIWHCLRALRFKYKPVFVEPEVCWQSPEDLRATVDAMQAAASLPRPRRPGGRFGKRPRQLAIEDGVVAEVEAEAEAPDPASVLAIEDQPPDVPVARLPEVENNFETDDAELFAPVQVLGTQRCEARIWSGGLGGSAPTASV